jgi:hypothetical protein
MFRLRKPATYAPHNGSPATLLPYIRSVRARTCSPPSCSRTSRASSTKPVQALYRRGPSRRYDRLHDDDVTTVEVARRAV